MKTIILKTIILIIFSSCSGITFQGVRSKNKNKAVNLNDYLTVDKFDYEDHFKVFEKFYIASQNTHMIKISKKNLKYLQKISNDIINNNELFFTKKTEANFFVINDMAPFHFSLPGRKIFISKGLINKYIKSEKLLYCLFTYELIRSEKNIYHKSLIIPTGTIDTNRILSLMRLSTFEKVEIHKWAFYILNRVGVETDNYLSWIQIQNRNSLDFSKQLGDINSISREESLFKAFLINNTKETTNSLKYSGSSKDFYSFVQNIKS